MCLGSGANLQPNVAKALEVEQSPVVDVPVRSPTSIYHVWLFPPSATVGLEHDTIDVAASSGAKR